MTLRRGISAGLAAAAVGLLLGGCRSGGAPSAPAGPGEAAKQKAVPASVSTAAPVGNAAPNELGRVLVVEYHQIVPKEARWARTPANFRKDLDALYQAGFRTVSMKDYVTGNINLPRGASPVVFTFDDGSEGQFRYLEKNGQAVIDPDCAVGMMADFAAKHPDFGTNATFYVLYDEHFGQEKYFTQKLKYLTDHGMEVGNHSWDHPALKKLSDDKVVEQLGRPQAEVQRYLPGYQFFSLALPYGISPRNKALAQAGTWQGTSYHHQAVMLVGSTPARSPYDKKFNPYAIQRVQATEWPGPKEAVPPALWFSAQLKHLAGPKGNRFVSDGDPNTVTVPSADQPDLDTARVGSRKVKTD